MSEQHSPEVDFARFIIEELDHFTANFRPEYSDEWRLLNQPFVGYAHEIDRDKKDAHLLICWHITPAVFEPHHHATEYASYLSPRGKIMAKNPGESQEFVVKDRTGFVSVPHFWELLEKAANFRPVLAKDGKWDVVECLFEGISKNVPIRSLRALLSGQPEGPYRREFRYTVQLPEKAILDKVQDEIFRLPLNRLVRISGAPGTGKTTVLIKRLSQKTKNQFLTDDEKALVTTGGIEEGRQWMLFSPSDLLKSYLKEALAKELLPASDDHVKVYGTFRLEVLRDMGFVRVGKHGYFRMPPTSDMLLLKNTTSRGQLSLSRTFTEFLKKKREQSVLDALQEFNNAIRLPLGQLADAAQDVLRTAIDVLSKAVTDVESLGDAQRRADDYRSLNTTINDLIQKVRSVADLGSGRLDFSSLPSIIRHSQAIARVAEELTLPQTGFAMFPEVPRRIETLRNAVRHVVESLGINTLFRMITRAYDEFRQLPAHQSRFFLDTVGREIKERMVSEPELDILLLHALDFVQSFPSPLSPSTPGISGDLQALLARLRLIIMVDEATDFSPLELACMERFALPRQGGVTISGDLMQRVTERGLRTWDDMSPVCGSYEAKYLRTAYRQTHRLFSIAKALCEHVMGTGDSFQSAYEAREADPPAVSFRGRAENAVEDWLTARICEIFALSEQHHLPTTAVLVPRPEDVAPLCAKLLPRIRENGLQLDASTKGQALGDAARVRVFPVEHIKGLEFEAVFYVGLDRMANIHRDLLDKYVYVGLSRARSFLGVTFEKQFPPRLKCIEDRFELNGSWGGGTPGVD